MLFRLGYQAGSKTTRSCCCHRWYMKRAALPLYFAAAATPPGLCWWFEFAVRCLLSKAPQSMLLPPHSRRPMSKCRLHQHLREMPQSQVRRLLKQCRCSKLFDLGRNSISFRNLRLPCKPDSDFHTSWSDWPPSMCRSVPGWFRWSHQH